MTLRRRAVAQCKLRLLTQCLAPAGTLTGERGRGWIVTRRGTSLDAAARFSAPLCVRRGRAGWCDEVVSSLNRADGR